MRLLRCVVFVTLVTLLAAVSRADDAADKKLASLCHALAEKHVALAKRLQSGKAKVEAWDELCLAVELDPDDKAARETLGYKKEGQAWLGTPLAPEPSDKELKPDLARAIEKEHREAAAKLLDLAKKAKGEDARRVAGLVLEEDPEDAGARALLGHAGPAWRSAREAKIAAAFARSLERASEGESKKDPADDAFEKLLGLGALDRRETEHFVILATKAADDGDMKPRAKALECVFDAFRYYFKGDSSRTFKLEGDAERTGTATASILSGTRARFLTVGDSEHARFVEACVSDKGLHKTARESGGWDCLVSTAKGPVFVSESYYGAEMRTECACNDAALLLTGDLHGDTSNAFLGIGLKRFLGGHASGRADIIYFSLDSGGGKHAESGGSFAELRARVRPAVRGMLDGAGLRQLLARTGNDLTEADSARGLAFIDFCLDRHRKELAELLADLDPNELPAVTLEKDFKKTTEELDRELRAWVLLEY